MYRDVMPSVRAVYGLSDMEKSARGDDHRSSSIGWVLELFFDKAPINDGVIGLGLAVQFDEPTGKWFAQYDG